MEISSEPLNRNPCAEYKISKVTINGVSISDLRSAVDMYINWEQLNLKWTSRSGYDLDIVKTCLWEQLKRIAKPLDNDIQVEAITSFIKKRLELGPWSHPSGTMTSYEYNCTTREHVVDFLLTLAGSSPKILSGIGM